MATLRMMLLALSFIAAVSGHNITVILNEYPEYSEFNNYLTRTKLRDEINSRQTVTVLVFNNTIASEYLANKNISDVKSVLSIHVLLDYFDLPKLQTIGGGSMTTTTLYQTTGVAEDGIGFVNITDLVGGKVGFGSGAPGSKLNALFFRSVKEIPYNISVLEITSPIIAPGVLKGPAAWDVNVTSLLEKAGCKTFGNLISDIGVLKVYEAAEPRGLTVFAPTDAAFTAPGLPDLRNLSNNDFISLLLYHAIPVYVPKASLMTVKNPIGTLATSKIAEFDLTVRTNGDSVTLSSGVDDSRVESTVLDSVPLSIFKIDHVLLPAGFFPQSPSSAPVPVPEGSPPSPFVPVSAPASAPVNRPIASSPAPVGRISPVHSPPAPPTSSPGTGPAPADNPTADSGDSSSSGGIKAPMIFQALITAAVSGIISFIVG